MNDKFYKILGESIKEARKKKGYTQEQLADRMKVARTTIGNWEQGRREANVIDILTICDILNIPIKELTAKAEKYMYK